MSALCGISERRLRVEQVRGVASHNSQVIGDTVRMGAYAVSTSEGGSDGELGF